ncbi:MAG TPA: TMEM175 family protein [Candidatus Limnocylindrales bacterium]|jgi:uncharacterized membrane protein|nr:TMEM175 family protein [Candidatus Limnocylindrales bacterium]
MTIRRRPKATATSEPHAGDAEHGLDFERLLFFSDAVFAIAITLLIIDVRLPELPDSATDADVIAGVRATLPSIFAYVLSFATIGLYWLAHWRRYRHVIAANERLVALNLVLLALIAFIPFPTGLIGEHGDIAAAVVIYAVSLSAAGIAGPLTWLYAWRAGLVHAAVTASYARYVALRGFSVPVVMLGSLVLLPLIGTTGVELSWLLIIPVQLSMNRLLHVREPGPMHDVDPSRA